MPNFFGLSKEYILNVYEIHHQMIHYGKWRFLDIYNLPIGLRTWFYNRLYKQLEEEKEQAEKAKRK